MITRRYFGSFTAITLLALWTGIALAKDASADNAAAATATSVHTKQTLVALERNAYEAWKSRSANFWNTFLSDKFVGWGTSGRLDKASATDEYSGADCTIASYDLSDVRVTPRGRDAALITYQTTVDGSCNGHKVPVHSWAASVYVRDGDKWKAVFHAAAPIVDPKAAYANLENQRQPPRKSDARSVDQNPSMEAMRSSEKSVWEAWREHDANKLSELMAHDISFINIFGTYLASRADALKNWSGTGCDVRSVQISDAVGTMLSSKVGILTFRADADGTCYGQKIGGVRGSSIYVKSGDSWKWTFGINLPAPASASVRPTGN